MTPLDCLQTVIEPALDMLPLNMTSDAAKIQLIAIGLQESRLTFREQIGGPAVSLWQMEKGGGIKGVLNHDATKDLARVVCAKRDVFANEDAVYKAMVDDDILAAAFARLLLWSDPKSLPAIGDADDAWSLYQRVWRPGKPHPETWANFYKQAVKAVQGD